jgi:pimeloyl-ACP methyl ester carboxylesterase
MFLQDQTEIGPAVIERSARFQVNGQTVAANLSLPRQDCELGVVFVHGWSGVRSGPNNLIVETARRLAAAGFASVRFDLRGRGESEGEGTAACLPTMSADLEAAVRLLAERARVRRFVLFGMCSGGNVAIGTLPRLTGVAGLILLSVYPFSDGDSFGRDVNRTWYYAREYWRKLWQKHTWEKLARGEIHYGQIARVLFGHFRKRSKEASPVAGDAGSLSAAPADRRQASLELAGGAPMSPEAGGGRPPPGATTAAREGASATGAKAPPRQHLAKLECGVRALMVYGTADPDAAAAKEYYGSFVRERRLPVEFVDIPLANHNFSSREWLSEVVRLSTDFCRSCR